MCHGCPLGMKPVLREEPWGGEAARGDRVGIRWGEGCGRKGASLGGGRSVSQGPMGAVVPREGLLEGPGKIMGVLQNGAGCRE